MARTTPSVKETVLPDTPVRASGSPARRLRAARAVNCTHFALAAGAAVPARAARAADDTPRPPRDLWRRLRAQASRVRTVPLGQPRRWAASAVVSPAQ